MDYLKIVRTESVEAKYRLKGLICLSYISSVDSLHDWALLLPGKRSDLWVVVLHGHGAAGDQLFTRKDIREQWLPEFIRSGAGILCPNLRGNSWMSPAAALDAHQLMCFLREENGMLRAVFCSGSMGGTGNLIYGVLYPDDVDGIVTRGTVTDIASYHDWCLRRNEPVLRDIAGAISDAYGGSPSLIPGVYAGHSALGRASRLNMPLALSHGSADKIMPVEQVRKMEALLRGKDDFFYTEIPGGEHDAPLYEKTGFRRVMKLVG